MTTENTQLYQYYIVYQYTDDIIQTNGFGHFIYQTVQSSLNRESILTIKRKIIETENEKFNPIIINIIPLPIQGIL
jgi:hypothetical protein